MYRERTSWYLVFCRPLPTPSLCNCRLSSGNGFLSRLASSGRARLRCQVTTQSKSMGQRGQVSVQRTKCGVSLLFLYLSGAPVDEARLHSLLVTKIFLLFYFHPTVGMKYYWSRQSCLLSSTIFGRQMVFDVMNLLYPNKTHHLPVVR